MIKEIFELRQIYITKNIIVYVSENIHVWIKGKRRYTNSLSFESYYWSHIPRQSLFPLNVRELLTFIQFL